MSNEIDLENDEEWLALVAGFRTHFWQTRVPELLTAWAEARELPQTSWPESLQRSIHGIAGSAGLIGYDSLGSEARKVDRMWDVSAISSEELMQGIEHLVECIVKVASEQD
jgi:HPt (histidine-containing phosphotransfer) domain-containing protein